MPFLSPAKLLVVLLVAIVVLGPDKLPKVARQVGSLWGDFRRLRQRLETDVRGNFPDLPVDGQDHPGRAVADQLPRLAGRHPRRRQRGRPAGAGRRVPATGPGGRRRRWPRGRPNRPNGVVHADEEASIPGVSISDPQGTVHASRGDGRACLTTRP